MRASREYSLRYEIFPSDDGTQGRRAGAKDACNIPKRASAREPQKYYPDAESGDESKGSYHRTFGGRSLRRAGGYEDEDIFIIGGGHIYEEFLPYCKVAHVTKIDHAYQADTFFPNLDETGEWEITADRGAGSL